MLRFLVSSALSVALLACHDAASEPVAAPAPDEAAFQAVRERALRLADAGRRMDLARDALLEAHGMRPDDADVNQRLGRIFAEFKLNDDALRHFELAHAARPDDLRIVSALVSIQTQVGRHERALELLPSLRADPGYRGEALYAEAFIRDHGGSRDEALRLVEQAAGLSPTLAYRALSLHGRYLMEAGDFAAARERFRASLEGRPNYKEALKGMADTSRRLGREEDAAHWDEVLGLMLDLTDNVFVKEERDQRKGTARHEAMLASDYVREQASQKKGKLRRLAEIHPQWEGALRQLAQLHMRDGERDEACAAVRRLIESHGDSIGATERGELLARYCGGGS